MHAARRGLASLTDAAVLDPWNVRLAPESLTAVNRIAGQDRVLREQYYDVLRMRAFRQSLVCLPQAGLDAEWRAERAVGLYVSTRAEPSGPMQFTAPNGAVMTTTNSAVVEYLRALAESWPARRKVGARSAPATRDVRPSG